jgi:hypothetical protein
MILDAVGKAIMTYNIIIHVALYTHTIKKSFANCISENERFAKQTEHFTMHCKT